MEQNNIHGDNIRGDKHEHYHEAPYIIPKLLTQKSGLASVAFVGREKDLAKITELLNRDSALLLLNGIGGIGKSTLASYYFNKERDKFDYCGFIEVGEDIKSSFSLSFSTSLDLKSEKIDDSFNEAMNKLQNLEGDKLLVLDDVKNIATQKDEINTILTLKNSGFKILFTSREAEENMPPYYLDIMNKEDATKLFLQYCPTDEIEKIDRILEYVDYHTFFIEMTAKTLEKRRRTLSLASMIEKFEKGEFSTIIKDKEASFSKLLSELFSNDKILKNEENLLFLKRLSVLPSIEISFEDLHTFLVCEDKEKLEILLNELVDNGWLIKSNGMYKFHQILKEFIIESHTPKLEDIENILDYFTNLMIDIYSTQDVLHKRNYLIYLETLNNFTKTIQEKNEKIAYLIHSEGYINFILGNYKKTKELYEKSFAMRKNILNEDDIQLAISYNGQASIAKKEGRYSDALELYRQSLEIREKNIWIEKVVIEYNNMSRMHKILEEYDKAIEYLEKSLNIRKQIYGEEHESTAKAYNVLGSLYQDISKDQDNEYFKKSYEYYYKSLNIRKQILQNNHPAIATSYNNIGTWFVSKKDWGNAIKYFKLVVDQFTGEENAEIVAVSYCMLGQVYLVESNYIDSTNATKRALKSFMTLFPANHPYIDKCKGTLDELEKRL